MTLFSFGHFWPLLATFGHFWQLVAGRTAKTSFGRLFSNPAPGAPRGRGLPRGCGAGQHQPAFRTNQVVYMMDR